MKKSNCILFKPRLSIYKSNLHIYAQVIDDINQNTIVSCSSLDLEIRKKKEGLKGNNCVVSHLIGIKLGIYLRNENISNIVFDNKYRFNGRIRALVEGIRSQGITI